MVATPSSNAILGATFSDITPKQKKELGIDNGLVINSLSPGKLKSLGLEKGMVITRVNNEKIRSVQELKEQLEKKSGGILLEIVTQSSKKEYIGFGL